MRWCAPMYVRDGLLKYSRKSVSCSRVRRCRCYGVRMKGLVPKRLLSPKSGSTPGAAGCVSGVAQPSIKRVSNTMNDVFGARIRLSALGLFSAQFKPQIGSGGQSHWTSVMPGWSIGRPHRNNQKNNHTGLVSGRGNGWSVATINRWFLL